MDLTDTVWQSPPTGRRTAGEMVRGVGRDYGEEKDSRREGGALGGDERREEGGDMEEVGGGGRGGRGTEGKWG